MGLTQFVIVIIHSAITAAILTFFIPVLIATYSRFKYRFKYSLPIAMVLGLIFIMNLNIMVAEYNKEIFSFEGDASVLVKLGIPIGFIGFLILFGTDINRWKDDP